MSDSIDDAKDFVDASKDATEQEKSSRVYASDSPVGYNRNPMDMLKDEDEEEVKPGQMTQYALYRDGFTPTTPTVGTLKPGCYEINVDSNCAYVSPMPKPSGLLLQLPEMRSDAVISVIENFWASEKDYKEGNDFVIGGATYKAGVLVYGPPGTGKSCTLKIVANKMVDQNGIVFYASCHPAVVMGILSAFGKIEPERKCVVILEDIDSLINNYGESGYLDMLDSAKTANNTLFIATTNYPDRLDPRIYNRPGRFSHVIKIGWPTAPAREAFLKAILKKHDHVQEIVDGSKGFSIDHLSALVNAVYREKKNLHSEMERLRTLFKIPESEPQKEMGISARVGTMGFGE